jgi:hypothetical protein
MADRVLELVAKLINLASSPEIEEARTSALKACRLIIEHKLVVGYRGDKSFGHPEVQKSKYPEPATMMMPHRGICHTCGRYIRTGQKVWHRRGIGVAHHACSYDSLYEG